MDIAVTEKENDKGNYMLYTRIVLEYPNQMIKDEVESYADKVKEEIIYLLESLLSYKNNHYASRSSITKLI
jgi:flagellar basal body-associated protein FliL